jgi:hypothetical protein
MGPLNDLARCNGAKSTDPAAELCKQCRRTEPSGEQIKFIEPAVRMQAYGLYSAPACINFMSRGVDIDAAHLGR